MCVGFHLPFLLPRHLPCVALLYPLSSELLRSRMALEQGILTEIIDFNKESPSEGSRPYHWVGGGAVGPGAWDINIHAHDMRKKRNSNQAYNCMMEWCKCEPNFAKHMAPYVLLLGSPDTLPWRTHVLWAKYAGSAAPSCV